MFVDQSVHAIAPGRALIYRVNQTFLTTILSTVFLSVQRPVELVFVNRHNKNKNAPEPLGKC